MAGAKLADAKEAAITFVGLMDLAAGGDQVAVVHFDTDAELVARLGADWEAAGQGIHGLGTRRGTRIDLGLQKALEELEGPSRTEGNMGVVVLLTDGIHTGAGPGLRIRVAVNVGQAELREGDYFGPSLNPVARLLAAGHGGTSRGCRMPLPAGCGRVARSRQPRGMRRAG